MLPFKPLPSQGLALDKGDTVRCTSDVEAIRLVMESGGGVSFPQRRQPPRPSTPPHDLMTLVLWGVGLVPGERSHAPLCRCGRHHHAQVVGTRKWDLAY